VPFKNTIKKNGQEKKKKRHMKFRLNLWLCPFKERREVSDIFLIQNIFLSPRFEELFGNVFLISS
jgi:hypothetical protein